MVCCGRPQWFLQQLEVFVAVVGLTAMRLFTHMRIENVNNVSWSQLTNLDFIAQVLASGQDIHQFSNTLVLHLGRTQWLL